MDPPSQHEELSSFDAIENSTEISAYQAFYEGSATISAVSTPALPLSSIQNEQDIQETTDAFQVLCAHQLSSSFVTKYS